MKLVKGRNNNSMLNHSSTNGTDFQKKETKNKKRVTFVYQHIPRLHKQTTISLLFSSCKNTNV